MPNKPEPPMNSKLPKPNTTNSELECYCVCHSDSSSNAYCEHCNGINEVGAVHNPRLKALIASKVEEARIDVLLEVQVKAIGYQQDAYERIDKVLEYCRENITALQSKEGDS